MLLNLIVVAALAASSADAFPGRAAGGARIIGGHDATRGQFPYQISMKWSLLGLFKQHMCGGSILNENWILTAGHCVTETPKLGHFWVDAGDLDFNTNEGSEQTIKVDKRITHPNYGGGVNFNDIALLHLSSPLTMGDYVKPIRLPQPNAIPTGTVTLSGWGSRNGQDSTGLNPKLPTVLQTVDLPLIDYETCLADWGSSSPLKDTNLCTGPPDGSETPCQGDSGGPLVQFESDGIPTIVGLVSWGPVPCSSPNHPAVYTRVSAFLDFISDTIANN
ncbi:trypsin-1-like [Hetaerina americana]|uniref:trypsin-1-like n=1 Tax=Hetaerina americana TaxID=62018 RepID=UPI003A7F175D